MAGSFQHHHKLFTGNTPLAHGTLTVGPLKTLFATSYSAVGADGMFLKANENGSALAPVRVQVVSADGAKVTMHGKEREWVMLIVDAPVSRYVRLNPMTEQLEVTSLADASTRFLATLTQLSPRVHLVDLHGTAMQLHQTFMPTLSANALVKRIGGSLFLQPVGVPSLGLFVIQE